MTELTTDISYQTPRVGVGGYVCHEGKVLMFYRIGKHGTGTWSALGGHLEPGEHWFETAKREAEEESGLKVHSPKLFCVTNDLFPETGKHYITLQVAVKVDDPTFLNAEPEKYQDLGWYDWDNLPQPLFPGVSSVLALGERPPYLDEQ